MKLSVRDAKGFGLAPILVVIVVVGILSAICYKLWQSNRESADSSQGNTSSQTAGGTFKVPRGYVISKGEGMSFAYPAAWDQARSPILNITQDMAVQFVSCQAGECEVRFDEAAGVFKADKSGKTYESVLSANGVEAYLIPIRENDRCRPTALFLRKGKNFVQMSFSGLCPQPVVTGDSQPSAGQLLYPDVLDQLTNVLKSVDAV